MERKTEVKNLVYYDIHTHLKQTTESDEVVACYNTIVGKETLPYGHFPLSCGIHPWHIQVDAPEEQLALFRRLVCNKQVVMIGEAGLDKQVTAPFDLQIKVFEEQIHTSEELKKPLVIHCVRAWDKLLAIHKERKPSMPWFIHGFRKKGELAGQLLEQGFFLSFGEYFQKSALQKAWPERLLIETDESTCPIQEIYQRIASMLQVSVDELSRQVEQTICNHFISDF